MRILCSDPDLVAEISDPAVVAGLASVLGDVDVHTLVGWSSELPPGVADALVLGDPVDGGDYRIYPAKGTFFSGALLAYGGPGHASSYTDLVVPVSQAEAAARELSEFGLRILR